MPDDIRFLIINCLDYAFRDDKITDSEYDAVINYVEGN